MFEVQVKQTDPLTVAFIEMHGPYAQTPEGYGRLYGWIAMHGLTPVGMPSAVYLTIPSQTPEAEALWELWAPVAGDPPESEPDESDIGIKHVESMTVASAMHHGPYETVEPVYTALWAWIAGNGYRVSGPPCETYFSDPKTTPPEEYLTEVQIPVERA